MAGNKQHNRQRCTLKQPKHVLFHHCQAAIVSSELQLAVGSAPQGLLFSSTSLCPPLYPAAASNSKPENLASRNISSATLEPALHL